MKHTILIGGPAGTGPNLLTEIIGKALVKQGNFVFYSRDYQSLIRGGHNFNTLTFSDKPVFSNESRIDLLVAFDEKSVEMHKKDLKQNGIILRDSDENMYFAGKLFKLFCLDFSILEKELKLLGKNFEKNIENARKGYFSETRNYCEIKKLKNQIKDFKNGSQGIRDGALKSGLEIYYAYPMTPATPVLIELGQATLDEKNKHKVIELENEIAVANAGVGSCMAGKKVMVGTAGGGFDLMTEALSLCGIAEIPLVFYLAQRPGPGTGVATYTAQGDLNIALYSGHGEFPRIVLAPGDSKESEELTNQAFYFSHKFKTPSIILSDKHLAESFFSSTEDSNLKEIKVLTKLKRFNSYESDSQGCATENPEIVEKNVLNRLKKFSEIENEAEKFEMFKIYGNKNSENLIISWGSTKGAILDAVEDLNVGFLQIKYLSPFSKQIEKIISGKNLILIENNSTGLLGNLIQQKTGIKIEEQNKILKFNGRPFFSDELKREILKRIVK